MANHRPHGLSAEQCKMLHGIISGLRFDEPIERIKTADLDLEATILSQAEQNLKAAMAQPDNEHAQIRVRRELEAYQRAAAETVWNVTKALFSLTQIAADAAVQIQAAIGEWP